MQFCPTCRNMYYITLSEDSTHIKNKCRNCGNEESLSESESIVCVSKTIFNQNKHPTSYYINEFTEFDPTLPRINTMKCPNSECKTNEAAHTSPTEIIFIRYDDVNLKFIYMCTTCKHFWNTQQNS